METHPLQSLLENVDKLNIDSGRDWWFLMKKFKSERHVLEVEVLWGIPPEPMVKICLED